MKNKKASQRRKKYYLTTWEDEPQGPNLWQRLTRFLIGVFALAVVVVVLTFFLPEVQANKVVDHEIAGLKHERDRLASLKASRKREFELLTTDTEFLEIVARDRLNLKKFGEEIYRIERQEVTTVE
ncbi:MAG: septum formation initiator family protein, partial [Verrucomicrobiota bacterium]